MAIINWETEGWVSFEELDSEVHLKELISILGIRNTDFWYPSRTQTLIQGRVIVHSKIGIGAIVRMVEFSQQDPFRRMFEATGELVGSFEDFSQQGVALGSLIPYKDLALQKLGQNVGTVSFPAPIAEVTPALHPGLTI